MSSSTPPGLAEIGQIAKMPDHELWMAAVRDPEGNVVELMSEVRK